MLQWENGEADIGRNKYIPGDWIIRIELDLFFWSEIGMDIKVCIQCGKEIDGSGILFRNQVFCGDACCDEFEEELSAKDAPSLEEMVGDDDDDVSDGPKDLGYRDDDDLDDDLDNDDDFNINEADF